MSRVGAGHQKQRVLPPRSTEVGTAVVELVLSGADFEVAAPRVERALLAEQEPVRRLGQVAAGDLARLHGRLTPAVYRLLRTAGLGSSADSAIKDVLTFVPFRALPGWFRYQSLRLSVRNYAEGRWLRLVDAAETLRDRLTAATRTADDGGGDDGVPGAATAEWCAHAAVVTCRWSGLP